MKPYILRNMGGGDWQVLRRRDNAPLGYVRQTVPMGSDERHVWGADPIGGQGVDYIHYTRTEAAEAVWRASLPREVQ